MSTLDVFENDSDKYALIIGKTHYILCQTDFCHDIYPIEETAEFLAWKEMCQPMTLDKFGHYWGVKPRIYANYELLKESMVEIGVSIENMPKLWK